MDEESPLIVGTMRLGKWGANFSTAQYRGFIESCLEMELTVFDHADIYGGYTTEAEFGAVLKGNSSLRDYLGINTKCGIRYPCDNRPEYKIKSYDSSKEHILASVENSLRAFHTDYLDRLILHRPDFLMDEDEVAEAFTTLEESGKVLDFGVSNFTTDQVSLLEDIFPLSEHQMEISLLSPEAFADGRLVQCQRETIQATAWSPLGGAAFFNDPDEPRHKLIRDTAAEIGKNHDATFDQIMLAFLNRHPAKIKPVTGTTKIERIRKAKAAMEINLSAEEWYMLWTASTGKKVP